MRKINPETKKLISWDQAVAALEEIAEVARSTRTKVALCGGIAMAAYGSDRLTSDIDVLVSTTSGFPNFPKGKALSFGGRSTRTSEGVVVDLIDRNDKYSDLYTDALDASVRMKGLPIPIVTPEYLATMKLQAGRDKDEQDLRTLINLKILRMIKTKNIIGNNLGEYAVDEFERVVEHAAWEGTRT